MRTRFAGLLALGLLEGCFHMGREQMGKWLADPAFSHHFRFEPMNEVPSGALAPAEGMAMVVFLYPTKRASTMWISGGPMHARRTILDEKGGYLGDAQPETHFAVNLAPGPHLFVAYIGMSAQELSGNTEGLGAAARGMTADLKAGKIYFVEVGGYAVDLLAIKPALSSWPTRASGMRDTKRRGVGDAKLAQAGQLQCCDFTRANYDWCHAMTAEVSCAKQDQFLMPGLDRWAGEVAEYLADVRGRVDKLKGSERDQHALGPDDGI